MRAPRALTGGQRYGVRALTAHATSAGPSWPLAWPLVWGSPDRCGTPDARGPWSGPWSGAAHSATGAIAAPHTADAACRIPWGRGTGPHGQACVTTRSPTGPRPQPSDRWKAVHAPQ